MLLQSHAGAVRLLPALPQQWAEGSVEGLVARGGFVCDFSWAKHAIAAGNIESRLGGILVVRSSWALTFEDNVEVLSSGSNALLQATSIPDPQIEGNPNLDVEAKNNFEYIISTNKGDRITFRKAEK